MNIDERRLKMEKPYRYRKRIVKQGHGHYVLIPAVNGWTDVKEVVLELYKKKIVIIPLK